jgi:predicted MPP superfamily phosphohydrolase
MKYLKTFESHSAKDILIIVDVQKSFKEFFTDNYIKELKKYCKKFSKVYQIWDNHHLGKNVDKDYLYDRDPEEEDTNDLYEFPNQVDLIEKRYNYKVDADFYKKILDKEVYNKISDMEKSKSLKKGDIFITKEETYIVYVGNKHKWHHLSKKLYDLLLSLKDKTVTIVGGADGECLEDIYASALSLSVNIKRDHRYIWSANHCPIK